MLVIKLILAVVVIGALIFGIKQFNQHCMSRFGHAFFTKRAFYITATAIAVFTVGNMWRRSSLEGHGDTLNGIVLMVVGVLIACWLIYENVRRTNSIWGIVGSVGQLGLFSVLAWVWLPLMAIALLCQFLALASAKPVYVVNR
ncbi:hypothetical protein PTKU46_85740 [Paraburkholderia terrae]|uniref:hypothetical protein n=1 Tax=Paraburkholderia terrae TaxID=311230 RepID=UPI0030DE5A73